MGGNCYDFKEQFPNMLTYMDGTHEKFYAMDTLHNLIDGFYCGNGYGTDLHELRVLQNGIAFLLSYNPEIVDMSHVVDGGDTNATVIGLIIQEIDHNKNDIFQWRSWDHFQITDATHENLTASSIDYVHGNALEIAGDENIILSSRHMDEITKINIEDVSIIWRWGGKHNQFSFINDNIGFSHQHAIRIISNGNYTLFDNGNYHNPPFSRALEYKLNENSKTATLVWQYENNPSYYGSAMGYVQRLSNGNTLIGWGATNPSITEVNSSGEKIMEISLPSNVFSYRAYEEENNPLPNPIVKSVPQKYLLAQNYPNPFNPSTKIDYSLPENSSVKLNIYDITGKLVLNLVNEIQVPGKYEVDLSSSSLSSGIYLYRLTANGFMDTKKLVVLK